MKKQLIAKLIALSLIVSISISVPTFASDSIDTNIMEKFNYLTEEISKENDILFSESEILLNSEVLSDNEDFERFDKVERLNEELYELVSGNPEQFKGFIITDEEKSKYIPNEILSRAGTPWNNYGDIFVRKTNLIVGSPAGHAGIGDYDKGFTIEAYPSGGVQFRFDYSKWKGDRTAGIYRPYSTTAGDYQKATNHSISKIGEAYNWSFKSTGTGYYCSELAYFSWKNANGSRLRVQSGEDYIVPLELAETSKTYKVDWPY